MNHPVSTMVSYVDPSFVFPLSNDVVFDRLFLTTALRCVTLKPDLLFEEVEINCSLDRSKYCTRNNNCSPQISMSNQMVKSGRRKQFHLRFVQNQIISRALRRTV